MDIMLIAVAWAVTIFAAYVLGYAHHAAKAWREEKPSLESLHARLDAIEAKS